MKSSMLLQKQYGYFFTGFYYAGYFACFETSQSQPYISDYNAWLSDTVNRRLVSK